MSRLERVVYKVTPEIKAAIKKASEKEGGQYAGKYPGWIVAEIVGRALRVPKAKRHGRHSWTKGRGGK